MLMLGLLLILAAPRVLPQIYSKVKVVQVNTYIISYLPVTVLLKSTFQRLARSKGQKYKNF